MKGVLVCAAACLLLSGCQAVPFARELEDAMLVQVLGVDMEHGSVVLTAACDPETGSRGTKKPVLAAGGGDMKRAQAALKAAGEEYVALTHVTQLVIGSKTDVCAVLESALTDRALGQSATVWLTESGSAEDLLAAVDGGAKRLSSIELNSDAEAVTVLQALREVAEKGETKIPLLKQEKGRLVLAGYRDVREWGGESGAEG